MKLYHLMNVAVVAAILQLLTAPAEAQKVQHLLVLVQDIGHSPVNGIKIGIAGGGDSKTTGEDGLAILTVAGDMTEKDSVSFQIVKSPPGMDFMLVAGERQRFVSYNKPDDCLKVTVMLRDVYYNALSARPKMRESNTRIQSPGRKQP